MRKFNFKMASKFVFIVILLAIRVSDAAFNALKGYDEMAQYALGVSAKCIQAL